MQRKTTKSARAIGEIRRSQVITTYGVGSVIAFEDESFMVAGLDRWEIDEPDLHEPRLEKLLHVKGFLLPPSGEAKNDIPVIRFPFFQSCHLCKRLASHKTFTTFYSNRCNYCNVNLVPSRFVVACKNGHIDEFPYHRWVHQYMKPMPPEEGHELSISSRGTTASLADIEISCSCGQRTTMQGALSKDALKHTIRCSGTRPWLGDFEIDCAEVPRALQRGASNVFFSVTRSAISIPPWSDGPFRLLNKYWTAIRSVPESALAATIEGMKIAEKSSYSVEELVQAAIDRKKEESGLVANDDDSGLKPLEYQSLLLGRPETSHGQEFVCVPGDEPSAIMSPYISKIMLVKRLREVRALQSFTRLFPPSPGDPPEVRAKLSRLDVDWLPAVEVLGEGVFIRLNEKELVYWESLAEVGARVARIDRNYQRQFLQDGRVPDRSITPRLVLIHTLAHALINQWALDCGYPAASLRERLYVSPEMAGFLIFTASGDSAGSLGGIVALGESGRIQQTIGSAMLNASWCSSDPLCMESEGTGVAGLNLAACHACVLLPETSCEESNLLLDRALLVGTLEFPSLGFFRTLIEQSDQSWLG